MPVLSLAVQLHGRGDEAGVRGDPEQSLGVRLGIDREPGRKEGAVASAQQNIRYGNRTHVVIASVDGDLQFCRGHI